jgi:predicted unusual protein kinase regulating ubiquinone biosynthesis (AarF/ABC1/UbiB family)
VPEVVDDLSTGRVLTTEFAEGVTFAEVLDWSHEERQLTAECLYRFAFGGIYGLHAFNGDPHPGNYLFHPAVGSPSWTSAWSSGSAPRTSSPSRHDAGHGDGPRRGRSG